MTQLVKNLPAMQETPVRFLGWEDPQEKRTATPVSWPGEFQGVAKSWIWLSDFHFDYIYICFRPHHVACRILVPWPGIEPVPPAVETQSLYHCQGSPRILIFHNSCFHLLKLAFFGLCIGHAALCFGGLFLSSVFKRNPWPRRLSIQYIAKFT